MRVLLTLLAFVSCHSYSEDGIVFRFKISAFSEADQVVSSYENAVLMKFEEDVSFDLHNQYRLSLATGSREGDSTRVTAALTVLDDAGAHVVGTMTKRFIVGEILSEEFGGDSTYALELKTSYGELPEGVM